MTAAFSIEPTRRDVTRLDALDVVRRQGREEPDRTIEMSHVTALLCRKMFRTIATRRPMSLHEHIHQAPRGCAGDATVDGRRTEHAQGLENAVTTEPVE